MKRFTSIILAISILITMSSTAFAQTKENKEIDTYTSNYSEVLEIDGETITFHYYSEGNSRFIAYEQNGVNNVTEFNVAKNELKVNGKLISQTQNKAIANPYMLYDLKARSYNNWTMYNSSTGNIVTATLNAVAVATTMVSVLGFGGVNTFIAAANTAVSLGTKGGLIYYQKFDYYLEPVTAGRPTKAYMTDFYMKPNAKDYFATVDTRY